ncbi:NAD(P)-binding protein, partial [Staphylococcus aureus]|uniref:NAD(P)-binding protein n=1 Tax=Staphylococcus aureus TaxID=1280 RepID=UPI0015C605DF
MSAPHSTQRNIAIIGAGPGGLAAGMMLSAWGYRVTMFANNSTIGGMSAKKSVGHFQFDTGPTFFSMPHILAELFQASGRKMQDYIQLQRIDPMYKLQFQDKTLHPTSDYEKMKEEIAVQFPGEEKGYAR